MTINKFIVKTLLSTRKKMNADLAIFLFYCNVYLTVCRGI
jgi:hypothetical protein